MTLPPEQQTIGQRIALTLVIVLAILFILAFIGWVSGSWEQAQSEERIPLSPHEEQFIRLDRQALESAYRDQIQHLFEVWMKDDHGQPARAITGARQARKAFEGTMEAIDRRERHLKETRP